MCLGSHPHYSTCQATQAVPYAVPWASHSQQSLLCCAWLKKWMPRAHFSQIPTGCTLQLLGPWWVNSEVRDLHWISFPLPIMVVWVTIHSQLMFFPFLFPFPPSLLTFPEFTTQMYPHTQILVSGSVPRKPKLRYSFISGVGKFIL